MTNFFILIIILIFFFHAFNDVRCYNLVHKKNILKLVVGVWWMNKERRKLCKKKRRRKRKKSFFSTLIRKILHACKRGVTLISLTKDVFLHLHPLLWACMRRCDMMMNKGQSFCTFLLLFLLPHLLLLPCPSLWHISSMTLPWWTKKKESIWAQEGCWINSLNTSFIRHPHLSWGSPVEKYFSSN